MIVGLDGFSLHPLQLDTMGVLEWAHAHGFAGVHAGAIGPLVRERGDGGAAALRERAAALGVSTRMSLGVLNPHAVGMPPAAVAREAAEGIAAAARHGWRELHACLGGPEHRYAQSPRWAEQLEASAALLEGLAPCLREHGCRISLETHGEVSTFELVRLVERVGPDILGICLDTANVMLLGEHPVMAARRAAPYTHMTHCKDAILFPVDGGLRRQTHPPGSGAIDWTALIAELAAHQPDLELAIEDHKWLFDAAIYTPEWQAVNSDAVRDEVLYLVECAWQCHGQIAAGERPDPDAYERIPYGDELEDRLGRGRDHLNTVLRGLAGETAGA